MGSSRSLQRCALAKRLEEAIRELTEDFRKLEILMENGKREWHGVYEICHRSLEAFFFLQGMSHMHKSMRFKNLVLQVLSQAITKGFHSLRPEIAILFDTWLILNT